MQELHSIKGVITSIRLKNSAFSPFLDHVYIINRKRTKNPALDNFLGGVLMLFEGYAETFMLESELTFSSQEYISEAWDPADPLFIFILVMGASEHVDDATVEELRQVLSEFTSSILEFGEDIFSPAPTTLTAEQRKFVREAATQYRRQHKNQTINAPFECSFPHSGLQPLPVQGKIKPAPSAAVDSSEEVFLALSDGMRTDDLSIFLRKLNDMGQPQTDRADTCTAEQENQLRIAAEAFLAPIKAVEVTVRKRQDPKGVVRRYVKDIRLVTAEEIQTKIVSGQLPL